MHTVKIEAYTASFPIQYYLETCNLYIVVIFYTEILTALAAMHSLKNPFYRSVNIDCIMLLLPQHDKIDLVPILREERWINQNETTCT